MQLPLIPLTHRLTWAALLAASAAIAQPCGGRFAEQNGMFVFEAEDFAQNLGYKVVDDPKASGGKLMQADKGPNLHYDLEVKTAGRWNIYMRHFSKTHQDNGLFFQLNGQDIKSDKGHNIIRMPGTKWRWHLEWQCGEGCHYYGVYMDLTPGLHRFSIRKRENAARADKLVLALKGKEPELKADTMGPELTPCADGKPVAVLATPGRIRPLSGPTFSHSADGRRLVPVVGASRLTPQFGDYGFPIGGE